MIHPTHPTHPTYGRSLERLNRYRIGTSMPALILDHARGFYAELYPPVTYYTAPDYVETGYIRGNP